MFGACAGRLGSGSGTKGLSVFCIDPGETTGWAWALVSYQELRSVGSGDLLWPDLVGRLQRTERFQAGEESVYRGPLSASSPAAQVAQSEAMTCLGVGIQLEQLHLTSARVSRGSVGWVTDVVIEDFILRQGTKDRSLLSPVRLTAGIVQEVLRSEKLIGLTILSASDSKSTITDDRLRRLGLWIVGQQHARDACRLLMLFLRGLDVGN